MKRSRAVRLLLLSSIFLIASGHTFAQQTAPPSGMGNACKFDAGPRAGQTQDYSHLGTLPLGSPCHDGQGSTGKVVALGGSSGGGPAAGMGNACKFDAGPRAGQTQDYSQLPPLPIGSPCHDGQGSTGKVVALGGSSGGGPASGMGNACKFDAGPRAGQTQDYSQLQPLPIGSPCHDGQGSTGKVVALGGSSGGGPASGMGNACKFDAGPRAGQTQDYSQLQPLPIGSPCHDGQGSTGKVVALGQGTAESTSATPAPSGKSKKCLILAGESAGSTEDFLIPLSIGTPCLTPKGVGVIVK